VGRHLGVDSQRQWSQLAILRTKPCRLDLFSITTLMADRLASDGQLLNVTGGCYWTSHNGISFVPFLHFYCPLLVNVPLDVAIMVAVMFVRITNRSERQMASYVDSSLIEGEKVQHEARISIWALSLKAFLGLIFLPVFGLGLLFWISAAITYYTTELAVTNKRVIAKFGLIRRNTIEMNVSKAESIQVDQGILGRIFDYGSIVVSGAGDPKAPIPGISNPLKFKKMFFEVQEEGRSASSE
jgi:hypothetical protein